MEINSEKPVLYVWVDRLRNRKQSYYVLKCERIDTLELPPFPFHYPDECITVVFVDLDILSAHTQWVSRVGGY
jgi:hypothetical protein